MTIVISAEIPNVDGCPGTHKVIEACTFSEKGVEPFGITLPSSPKKP